MTERPGRRNEGPPPDRFLIPVDGLKVPRSWAVGRAFLHPGADARSLVYESPPFNSSGDVIQNRVFEILDGARDSSVAEVRGVKTIDDAVDAVRASLDTLRLFQLARRTTRSAAFGLPGDLHRSRLDYVAAWDRSAHGFRFFGDAAGWTFTHESFDDWATSSGFQFLSNALQDPSASDAARRAGIGAQLFSRAALEHRSDLKMLGIVAALEAWLLTRKPGAQTLRLARHVAWFGCGRHANDLCGRDRPICPYLHLKPGIGLDRSRLETLRELGNAHVAWRCAEWHRVMDWYDARSGAAHGDPTAVDPKEADQAEYWVAHYLAEPILDWLRTHPDDPVGELAKELDRVRQPEGWRQMTAALDVPSPPERPPIAG